MPSVQKDYRTSAEPTPEPASIWLVIDIDPRGSFDDGDLAGLRADIETVVRKLVNDRIDQNHMPKPNPKYYSGVTPTKQLEVTKRLRP